MSAQGGVVADTTPLNYLILIGQTEVLHQLFGEVMIAAAEARGLLPIGTLNILDLADERGLLDGVTSLEALKQTTFRTGDELLERFAARMMARKV